MALRSSSVVSGNTAISLVLFGHRENLFHASTRSMNTSAIFHQTRRTEYVLVLVSTIHVLVYQIIRRMALIVGVEQSDRAAKTAHETVSEE